MTQTAAQPEKPLPPTPLTNPVPGAWIQLSDRSIPPVYVPFEPILRKNEATGKDEVTGHGPGAHIKRLLGEGAMYTNDPAGIVPLENAELASTEAALRVELEQSKAIQEAMMAELKELREKMASDPNIPNTSKKPR